TEPLDRLLKQLTGFVAIAQPGSDSAEGQDRIRMGWLLRELGEERYRLAKSSSRSFPATLSFENQANLRQGDGFASSLVACTERVQRLLVVGQGFRKMVLYVVYFANAKQFVAVQFSVRRHWLEERRLVEGPGGGEREKEQSQQDP